MNVDRSSGRRFVAYLFLPLVLARSTSARSDDSKSGISEAFQLVMTKLGGLRAETNVGLEKVCVYRYDCCLVWRHIFDFVTAFRGRSGGKPNESVALCHYELKRADTRAWPE